MSTVMFLRRLAAYGSKRRISVIEGVAIALAADSVLRGGDVFAAFLILLGGAALQIVADDFQHPF